MNQQVKTRNLKKKNTKPNDIVDKKKQGLRNRETNVISFIFVALFLMMASYLVYFNVFEASTIVNNPYNKRIDNLENKVVRGNILAADGQILAETDIDEDGNETRVYPFSEVFCHVVGLASAKTGVEGVANYELLSTSGNIINQLSDDLSGEKSVGYDVVTTLVPKLQEAAYKALGSNKGAVVAMEPSTGRVLAMVSKPDYDPNTVRSEWDSLVADEGGNSALLNRATQGLYPPGSTFKILTAMEYMRENPSFDKYRYECSGSDTFGGNVIRCYNGEQHGTVDLKSSLAHSCNGSFAHIGVGLNRKSYRKLCEAFGFNSSLGVKFVSSRSRFVLDEKSDTAEAAQTAIGQGKTTITPLQNALISATIANDGVMMTPYLVDHTESVDGHVVKKYEPQEKRTVISRKRANQVTRMMRSVVSDGTAAALRNLSYPVAGKTGTAEIDSEGTSHAWFVGFAPAADPKIAVSVIVEGAGTGSQYAVPIAAKMLEEYLGN